MLISWVKTVLRLLQHTDKVFENDCLVVFFGLGRHPHPYTFTHLPVSITKLQQRRTNGRLYLGQPLHILDCLKHIPSMNEWIIKMATPEETYRYHEIRNTRRDQLPAFSQCPKFQIRQKFWETAETHRPKGLEAFVELVCVFTRIAPCKKVVPSRLEGQ